MKTKIDSFEMVEIRSGNRFMPAYVERRDATEWSPALLHVWRFDWQLTKKGVPDQRIRPETAVHRSSSGYVAGWVARYIPEREAEADKLREQIEDLSLRLKSAKEALGALYADTHKEAL